MAAGNYTLTVTAKTGPGLSVTSKQFANVSEVRFRFANGAFDVIQTDPPVLTTFQYSDVATVTTTPATKVMTIST